MDHWLYRGVDLGDTVHLMRISNNPKERDMAATPGRAAFLERRIEQMQAELEYVYQLPEEPRMESEGQDGPNVIWWDAKFPNGQRRFTYAAVRADNGLWYTTGPHSPKGYSWADLIEWIAKQARPVDGIMWVASEWEPEILP
jgi:hypothetical protein